MKHDRKIKAIITAITGVRVIVSQESLIHAMEEHFSMLPEDILLELVERILKDPSEVYSESGSDEKQFDFFYRLENGKYIVAVVKTIMEGSYLSSMYPTGKKPRAKHKKFKKVRL